MIYFSTVCFA